MPPQPPATIGVMIPTFNRRESVLLALSHLEHQTCRDFAVLVVVDGSTDGTLEALELYRARAAFPLTILAQPNSGVARARNHALEHLRSPLCVMIGDDIFPEPGFLEAHLRFHLGNPAPSAAAVGYTRWDEQRQRVTPFMRWLDHGGVQFAYGDLLAGVQPTWQHFYPSNLSLKTDYLRAHPAHEGFACYGFEDIELGYRLSRRHGLTVSFLRDAVAQHLHPATFAGTCRRAIHVGAAAYTFGQLWPEHQYHAPRGLLKRTLLPLLAEPRIVLPTLRALTGLLTRVWCPNPLLRPLLMLHERAGYAAAKARASGTPAPLTP